MQIMNDIKNFNNYKNAKEAIIKFEEAISIIDVSLHSLKRFTIYMVIKEACLELRSRRELIKIELDKCKKLVDNKG